MAPIRAYMRSHPLLVAVLALVAGLAGIWLVPSDATLAGMVPVRVGLSVVMFAVLGIVAGRGAIEPSSEGMAFAFRKSAYLLALALAAGALAVATALASGSPLVPNWPWQLASAFVLCFFVGMFEEGLFRGIVLGALLARMGRTRAGVLGAAVVSSLLFGVVHVLPFVIGGQVSDALGLAQAVLKTLQTGIVGLLMAAVFVKTRNIWTVVLVHGLNDLFAMVAEALFAGTVSTQYVNADPTAGLASVVVYLVFLVLYVPVLVSAVRMLRRVEVPCRGPFADDRLQEPERRAA